MAGSAARGMNKAGLSPAESACLAAFGAYLAGVYRDDFGVNDAAQTGLVAQDWFHPDARHDFRFAEMGARLPAARRFLDLASGMGTATLRGLDRGLDGFGLEPDAGKLALMRRRILAGNFPAAWTSRFARAVGEKLPYKDASFDAVLSYQTLEHVENAGAVLAEMLRVVKPGGALHLGCPDYRGTFEGHYLLPWLPLMPRPMARFYLRLLGRPTAGYAGIRYTTRSGLIRSLKAAARKAGLTVQVVDLERERLRNRLGEKGLPRSPGFVFTGTILAYARRLFRQETQVNLWVTVASAPR
jgi:ubiquinone/menaquinone biosynthesis C-methylase UbiE